MLEALQSRAEAQHDRRVAGQKHCKAEANLMERLHARCIAQHTRCTMSKMTHRHAHGMTAARPTVDSMKVASYQH